VAVGGGGYEFTYSGGTWSSGNQIDPTTNEQSDQAGGQRIDLISDRQHKAGNLLAGQAYATDLDVSCTSSSFCMAVDSKGYGFAYSDGTWTSGHRVEADGLRFRSISCPTYGFCVAVSSSGYEFTYSGGTWSSGRRIDPNSIGLESVSCATTTFCVTVGFDGYEFTYSRAAYGG
jgi:frataxin-like iron-binding protein CyaY